MRARRDAEHLCATVSNTPQHHRQLTGLSGDFDCGRKLEPNDVAGSAVDGVKISGSIANTDWLEFWSGEDQSGGAARRGRGTRRQRRPSKGLARRRRTPKWWGCHRECPYRDGNGETERLLS